MASSVPQKSLMYVKRTYIYIYIYMWHKRTNKLNLCYEDKWTDKRRPLRWSEVRAARNTETGWRNVTHAINELPACLLERRPGRRKKKHLVGRHLVGVTDAPCCQLYFQDKLCLDLVFLVWYISLSVTIVHRNKKRTKKKHLKKHFFFTKDG